MVSREAVGHEGRADFVLRAMPGSAAEIGACFGGSVNFGVGERFGGAAVPAQPRERPPDRTSLLERAKFLAIFTSNLDEFVMKRMAILRCVESAEGHALVRRVYGELPNLPEYGGLGGIVTIAGMRDVIILIVHVIVTVVRLAGPGDSVLWLQNPR